MTEDLLKPAASLTANRIRRTTVAVPAEQAIERVAAAPVRQERESISLPLSAEMSEVVHESAAAVGLLTWRRAGLFGIVYLGALLVFAAAFNVWPMLDR